MDDEMMTFARAISLVRACIPVLEAIDASGLGIHMPLSKEQVELLRGIEAVENYATGMPGGGWDIEEVTDRAGLSPSSWGMLTDALRQHSYRQPGIAQKMMEHVLQQFGDGGPNVTKDEVGAPPCLREVPTPLARSVVGLAT